MTRLPNTAVNRRTLSPLARAILDTLEADGHVVAIDRVDADTVKVKSVKGDDRYCVTAGLVEDGLAEVARLAGFELEG